MRDVQLHSMVLENFQSYKSETIEQFPEHGGFFFLSGKNESEPRLGANGAGKSTLFNALVWCLYGVTAKGGKTSDVLSWGAKKVCVSIALEIGGQPCVITREGPPNRLYVDDAATTQDEIDALLGLSRARFLHSVLFGQDCRFFIDLPVADRAVLLDEVLDLSVWQSLSDAAKAKTKSLETQVELSRREIARLQGRLSSYDTTSLEQKRDAWEATYTAETTALVDKLDELEKVLERAGDVTQAAMNTYDASMKAQDTHNTKRLVELTAKTRELQSTLGALKAETASAERHRTYYAHTESCVACGQKIDAKFAREKVLEASATIASNEKRIDQINKQLVAWDVEALELTAYGVKLTKEHNDAKYALRNAQNDYQRAKLAADQCYNDVERRLSAPAENPFVAEIERVQEERASTGVQIQLFETETQKLEGEALTTKFWIEGFKRVRLFLIKRILSTLEIEVNNAASALGLPDWHIAFKTETETKSGGTKFGVRIEVSSGVATGAWEVWSGGEGQRIKLAVAIGLANLIQRMAGVHYTFEVWDEPTAWLSQEGVEDLIECLRYRSDTTGKAVWLVDQRAHEVASFNEIWRVTKTSEGSKVSRIAVGI